MKKRIKNAGQFRRFYASGIPMQREKDHPFAVAAGTMVNVILVKTKAAIVECKCSKEQKAELGMDSVVLQIPLDNFAGDKITREKATKKSTKTPKVVAVWHVTAETAPPTVDIAPEAAPVPQVEVEPVQVAETPVEAPAEPAVV